MKTKLITALRMSASALRGNRFAYAWHQPHSCNNGVLACALTGMSMLQLKERTDRLRIHSKSPSWTDIAGTHCPISGQPTDSMFSALVSYGLTVDDIVHLEYCNDPKVLKRMGFVAPQSDPRPKGWWKRMFQGPKESESIYTDPQFVAKYMTTWADLLQEEGRMDRAPQQTNQTNEKETNQNKTEQVH